MRNILVLNRMPKSMANYAEWFEHQDIQWTIFGWQDIVASYEDHSTAIFYKNYTNDKIVKDVYDLCKTHWPSVL